MRTQLGKNRIKVSKEAQNKIDQRVKELMNRIYEYEDTRGNVEINLKQALTQTRQEAFEEALELVGKDYDTPDNPWAQFAEREKMGYNQAKAELREALQAKRDEI